MSEIWIYCAITMFIIGAACNVALIGQPRKPVTPGAALVSLLFTAVFVVTGLWTLWGQR